MKNIISIVLAALLLGGCTSSWRLTNGIYKQRSLDYEVSTPAGWYQKHEGNTVVFTRNGLGLESIIITAAQWNDSLPIIKQQVRREWKFHEFAHYFLAELRNSQDVFDVTVDTQRVDTLFHRDCYVLEYSFNNPARVRMKTTALYCPAPDHLFLIRYSAPQRFYFEAYRKDFEALVASFIFLDISDEAS